MNFTSVTKRKLDSTLKYLSTEHEMHITEKHATHGKKESTTYHAHSRVIGATIVHGRKRHHFMHNSSMGIAKRSTSSQSAKLAKAMLQENQGSNIANLIALRGHDQYLLGFGLGFALGDAPENNGVNVYADVKHYELHGEAVFSGSDVRGAWRVIHAASGLAFTVTDHGTRKNTEREVAEMANRIGVEKFMRAIARSTAAPTQSALAARFKAAHGVNW